jgi:hypothetical protein
MDVVPQNDHEANYRLWGSLAQAGPIVIGGVISSSPASVGLELLLELPKRRGTRRGGDGESTRSASTIAPTAAAARTTASRHVGGYPIMSNYYEVLRRLTSSCKMA